MIKEEKILLDFFWDGKKLPIEINDVENIEVPRVGEYISFPDLGFSDKKAVSKIEHSYSEQPAWLVHVIHIYCE